MGGAGAALLTVVLSAMVIGRFPGASLAPAMGGFLAAYPLGLSIALVALPVFAAWRASMVAIAVICALVLVAVPFVLPAGAARSVELTRREDGKARRLMHPGEWAPVVTAGIAWTVFNAAYAVLLGFTPAVLTARGASAETAGVIASIAGWACVPLAPVGGALAERTGRPVVAAITFMVIAIIATAGLAVDVGPQSGALLLTGLLISIVATVIMTLPARALLPETRATGMGVYYTIFCAGMAALPPVAGWAADAAGSAAAALGVASVYFIIATVAVAICGVLLTRRVPTLG